MSILMPVSVGELLDKISILRIKKGKIKDKDKLKFVSLELTQLMKMVDKKMMKFIDKLEKINRRIWTVEDKIRKKEKDKIFDDKFIALARSVYHLNDDRFMIKNEINKQFSSEIREQKQ